MNKNFHRIHFHHKKLLLIAMGILLISISGLKAQTTFWGDNFDTPASCTNNAGVGWVVGGPMDQDDGALASNLWKIGSASAACTSGKKLYVGNSFTATNSYVSDNTSDIFAISPSISTVGVTGITLTFDWRCDGIAGGGVDYGQVGLSSDGGNNWTWLSTQYQNQGSCTTTSPITIPNTYEGIANFKIAFRFLSHATSCGSCDPPFNVDNILLKGTVNNCPVIGSQTSTNPTCQSGSTGTATIVASGCGLTYTLTPTPTGTAISNSTGTFSNLTPGTYTVAVTNGSCSVNGTNITISSSSTVAEPTATNNGPLCVGGNLQLNAATVSGGTYSWTGPNGFSSTQQNPTRNAVTAADSGNYIVVVTVAGCTNSDTTHVSIGSLATPTVSNNGPLCVGDTMKLSASTVNGGTYSWTGPNSYNVQNPTLANATLAAAGTYTLVVTVGSCSSTPVSTTVVISNAPASPTAGNNSVGSTLCEGSTLNLTASAVSGAAYVWTGPNSNSFNTQNPSLPNVTLADAGTYSVVATVGSCSSAPGTTTVTVTPRPASPTVTNNGPLCVGDTLVLSASTVGGATYSWSGPNSFSSNSQNATKAAIGINDAGSYGVVITVAGCSSNAASTTVVVNTSATPPTITLSHDTICPNDSAQICAQGNYATYSWNTGEHSSCIYVSEAGNYYVTVTTNSGCSVESSHYPLYTYLTPSVSISVSGDTLTGHGSTSYQWYKDGQLIPGATGTIYIATSSGNYSVGVTDEHGCNTRSSVVQLTTGISVITGNGFTVYPNPVNDQLTIEVSESTFSNKELNIFDASGKLVIAQHLQMPTSAQSAKTNVNVSMLAAGIYLLKIDNTIHKFVKQ